MKKYVVLALIVALGALVFALVGVSHASKVAKAAPVTAAAAATQETPTATDPDNVQEGDQKSPDAVAPQSSSESETQAASESATESEPGDANLPGGGHADGPGDVQHEFDGVE